MVLFFRAKCKYLPTSKMLFLHTSAMLFDFVFALINILSTGLYIDKRLLKFPIKSLHYLCGTACHVF